MNYRNTEDILSLAINYLTHNLDIYIITLPSRLNYVNYQIKKYNKLLNSSIKIKAYEKKKLNLNYLNENKIIDLPSFKDQKNNGEDILGQIACAISHYNCLYHFNKHNKNSKHKHLLILEDDFKFNNSEEYIIIYLYNTIIQQNKSNLDLINLGKCYHHGTVEVISEINIQNQYIQDTEYIIYQLGRCTHSLLFSYTGIYKILVNFKKYPLNKSYDEYLSDLQDMNVINCGSLFNRLVDQEETLGSNISISGINDIPEYM